MFRGAGAGRRRRKHADEEQEEEERRMQYFPLNGKNKIPQIIDVLKKNMERNQG